MCVREDEGEMKAFPREFLPDYPANEGKNQKRGGGMQGEEKNTEKEEAALYIIAHCIIYKETRNNRMQCRSAVLPPEAARKVRTRSAAACERRHLHLNPVSADMFYKCVCFNVSLPVCVWSLLFHEGSLLISH